jgi:hypothetical protein
MTRAPEKPGDDSAGGEEHPAITAIATVMREAALDITPPGRASRLIAERSGGTHRYDSLKRSRRTRKGERWFGDFVAKSAAHAIAVR